MFLGRYSCAVLAACLWTASPPAVAAGETNVNTRYKPLRVERLTGMKVEDLDGRRLARVHDFALDLQAGRVKYVLLGSGGFLGIGSRVKAVPPQTLFAGTAKRDTVAISVIEDEWERAPALKSTKAKALQDPALARRIAAFYESTRNAEALAETRSAHTGHGAWLSPVGRKSAGGKSTQVKLASDLIGSAVVNRQREKLGELIDVLVGFESGAPAFAIVSAGKLFDTERRFAVPVRALKLSNDGSLELDASRALLEQARPFNNTVWQSASLTGTPELFLYSGPKVANQETSDKKAGARIRRLTPFDQSNAEADLRITRQLRRSLMSNATLSFASKNVEIIARNGKVTLQGEVPSTLELNTIVRAARKIAGAENVEAQLTVQRHSDEE